MARRAGERARREAEEIERRLQAEPMRAGAEAAQLRAAEMREAWALAELEETLATESIARKREIAEAQRQVTNSREPCWSHTHAAHNSPRTLEPSSWWGETPALSPALSSS